MVDENQEVVKLGQIVSRKTSTIDNHWIKVCKDHGIPPREPLRVTGYIGKCIILEKLNGKEIWFKPWGFTDRWNICVDKNIIKNFW